MKKHIVCIASEQKGNEFLEEAQNAGWHVTLVTRKKLLDQPWAWTALNDVKTVEDDAGQEEYVRAIANIAGSRKIDRIVGLDEFDVTTAARAREHLQVGGMTSSHALRFRDKLSMAVHSQRAGIRVPEFVQLMNQEEVHEYMQRVPGPWVIKPRSDVSAIGIKKVDQPNDVWGAIEEMNARENLRERASYYVLARFIAGEVFHVDSLVNDGKVVFAGTNQYGRPPMQVAHQGGAYISRTVARGSADEKALFAVNKKLIKALGLERGATHAEFIKSDADGQFYFLEIAARVGGAYIAEVLEAASGVNLWREWARLEIADGKPKTKVSPARKEYAGIVLSLAKQEKPDTSAYVEEEIIYRVKKRHHAGLIVRAQRLERVTELLDDYAVRFADDFVAVAPPPERPE